MTKTPKIPQVAPSWSYGIYTGQAVVTPRPYGYDKATGTCPECDRADGTHARTCGMVN